jgi:hypothetical protein
MGMDVRSKTISDVGDGPTAWHRNAEDEGLQNLKERQEVFADEEELLGSKTVSKLYRVRDGYLRSQIRSFTHGYSVKATTIEVEFEAELKEMAPKGVDQFINRA